jgi:cysteine desulfurase
MIYLDHAATTPMRPGVWESMEPFATEHFGNSSGSHQISRAAKNALEEARERVGRLLGAAPGEIVFTSGGTESDNLALKGALFGSSPRRGLVTVDTEHEAVLATSEFLGRMGLPTTVIGVDHRGMVSRDDIASAVDDDTAVVSVMAVNNETGVAQDLPALVETVKRADPEVLFHTDAVQAFAGYLDVASLGVDMLSLSGHKFGGPKGVGVLYVREGVALEPVIHGGGQEWGRRSGTHNVAGAVGMASAMELAWEDRPRFETMMAGIRGDFEKRALEGIEDARVNGEGAPRSPHHLNLSIPGVPNQTLLMRLDRSGVAASAGSACQSGAVNVSHVLMAMGLGKTEARESVRFSFGWDSTYDEGAEAASILVDLVGELR